MLTIRRSTVNGLENVSRDAVADLLPRGDANLWFHFDAPTEEELRFLQEDLKIHHLTLEDVVNQNQRPKVESFEDYVYIAIHPLMHKQEVADRTFRARSASGPPLDRLRPLRPSARPDREFPYP